MMGCTSPGFTRLQALDSDAYGRLHVLDSFAAAVIIFDSADRTYVTNYGEYGLSAGKLRVPMDVVVSSGNMAIVTAGDGSRVEMLPVP
jgi:hypothetical protein